MSPRSFLQFFSGVIIGCWMLLQPSTSWAGVLYTIGNFPQGVQQLFAIDTRTFQVSSVGPLGLSVHYSGMDYDPINDRILSGRGDLPFVDDLILSIDRMTGMATTVPGSSLGAHGLAYDSASGSLYAAPQLSGLYRFNLSTQQIDFVGPLSGVHGRTQLHMDFDGQGRLLALDNGRGDIYQVNTNNGALNRLVNGPDYLSQGFTYDPDENVFWSLGHFGDLYSFDPANNFARTTRATGIPRGLFSMTGLTYVGGSVNAVPEPSSLALAAASLIACVVVRSSKRTWSSLA